MLLYPKLVHSPCKTLMKPEKSLEVTLGERKRVSGDRLTGNQIYLPSHRKEDLLGVIGIYFTLGSPVGCIVFKVKLQGFGICALYKKIFP